MPRNAAIGHQKGLPLVVTNMPPFYTKIGLPAPLAHLHLHLHLQQSHAPVFHHYQMYFLEARGWHEFVLGYSRKTPYLNTALSNERLFARAIRDQAPLLRAQLLEHQTVLALGPALSRMGALPLPLATTLQALSQ